MADTRDCEQCGTWFVPRREHARFCSARCRAAWNREHLGDPAAAASALVWAITAMSDTTGRLPKVGAADRPRGFAVIGEAVWWVTIVDATLVRHHPDVYDSVLAGQAPAQCQLVEETDQGDGPARTHRTGELPLRQEVRQARPVTVAARPIATKPPARPPRRHRSGRPG